MIRIKTEQIMARVRKYMRIASVKLLSIVSTSLEKRFVIRPRGVVSKKDIGALSTRVMALFSMTLLAVVPMIVKDKEKPNISKACVAPNAAYTPIYVPSLNPNLFDVQYESHKLVEILAPCDKRRINTTSGALKMDPDALM